MKDQIEFDSTKPALLRRLMKEHGDSKFPVLRNELGRRDD